ncbi:hypothetical protein OAM22_01805, partial [Candidatus Pelagibacter sp.]|nr:hypothetical protein [Candidatus Pelagibacter sp.]
MIKKVNELSIWDCKNMPNNSQKILLWNKRSKNFSSIINFIDDNSKRIKQDVLDLFCKFGNKKISKTDLVNYYNIENKF